MGEPLSLDRVFDFSMDALELHPAYDFFVPGPLPGYAGNPNNKNGWIEADVPLLVELGAVADEPMVGPLVDEIVELIVEMEELVVALVIDIEEDMAMLFGDGDFSDDDSEGFEDEEGVWQVNKEWLMAPITPSLMSVVPPPSTYKVRSPFTAAAEGQSFPLPAPGLHVPPSVIEDLTTRMGNLELWRPRWFMPWIDSSWLVLRWSRVSRLRPRGMRVLFMASGDSDRDAKDVLSKLLQMCKVAECQQDFEMLINRITGISESLLTLFYISRLKLTIQIELLRARPTTLGEAFFLSRIIEARFEAIIEKEKDHIHKKKRDTILSLQHKLVSPEIKGSLDTYEDIRVDEVSSAIDCVIRIGEINEVCSKKSRGVAEGGRKALYYVQDSGRRKKKKMEAEIQRILWDPEIKIF
nr:hypothetical protein [Tanacetum cinerariifolium]GFA15484.1 hypothetical protein [Tanacetum cinerariifolium]